MNAFAALHFYESLGWKGSIITLEGLEQMVGNGAGGVI